MAEEVKTMSDGIVEGYNREAVQKGLELKAEREKEDALIALAEEYLASQEPPPVEPEVRSKQPEKVPEPYKK
jgi:hypothetical protein